MLFFCRAYFLREYIFVCIAVIGRSYLHSFQKKGTDEEKKRALNLQFKDTLYFISVSLTAGKSLETAILEAYKSILGIYPDPESDIVVRLEIMNKRLLMNEPVEKSFWIWPREAR